MKTHALIIAAICTLAIVGCSGEPEAVVSDTEAEAPVESVLQSLIVDQAPADAVGVLALRESDADAEVVVTGIIGGREVPFVEGRAMFTLSDAGIEYCALDEGCKTPWDACCNPPEDNIASMITVQITDAEGAIVREDIQGVSDLSPMAEVTVVGDVAQRDDDVLILNAKQIYVHPSTD